MMGRDSKLQRQVPPNKIHIDYATAPIKKKKCQRSNTLLVDGALNDSDQNSMTTSHFKTISMALAESQWLVVGKGVLDFTLQLQPTIQVGRSSHMLSQPHTGSFSFQGPFGRQVLELNHW